MTGNYNPFKSKYPTNLFLKTVKSLFYTENKKKDFLRKMFICSRD